MSVEKPPALRFMEKLLKMRGLPYLHPRICPWKWSLDRDSGMCKRENEDFLSQQHTRMAEKLMIE